MKKFILLLAIATSFATATAAPTSATILATSQIAINQNFILHRHHKPLTKFEAIGAGCSLAGIALTLLGLTLANHVRDKRRR